MKQLRELCVKDNAQTKSIPLALRLNKTLELIKMLTESVDKVEVYSKDEFLGTHLPVIWVENYHSSLASEDGAIFLIENHWNGEFSIKEIVSQERGTELGQQGFGRGLCPEMDIRQLNGTVIAVQNGCNAIIVTTEGLGELEELKKLSR